ncbi:MAG: DUF4173 domain-containing protein [Candidatus Hydrogenedentes bacterium]|nr:DUF4173 domain-containing protein [Candidatus Hydrogenedentota bacterium]
MSNARSPVIILAFGFGLGLLGDALLRADPWGLNAALWAGAFTAGAVLAMRLCGIRLSGGRTWLLPLVLVFGVSLAWRDSITLKTLDCLAVGVALTTLVLRPAVAYIRRAAIADHMCALLDAGAGLFYGAPALILADIPFEELAAPSGALGDTKRIWLRHASSAAIGIAVAVPLLVVFGALFSSADAGFRVFIRDLFDIDWVRLRDHAAVTFFCAWVVAGYLRVLILKQECPISAPGNSKNLSLNTLALAVPMASLNGLFLTFLVVQGRYMFGGHELVAARTGLTYAEYARQGFFQLVVVAALALSVLLAADWMDREAGPKGRRVFRVQAMVLVVLVYVVLISAIGRMRLYQQAYGLTELRVYTMAFMMWLAVVLAWFVATVLRGHRDRFAFGALAAAMAFVFGLHVFNPDAYIVRSNIRRATLQRPFDAAYAATLSADAIPAIVEAFPSPDNSARNAVLSRAGANTEMTWRTWSWSRHRARQSLAGLEEGAPQAENAVPSAGR